MPAPQLNFMSLSIFPFLISMRRKRTIDKEQSSED